MQLVVNKVVQFQHVLDTNGDATGEFLASAAIEQVRLTRGVKTGALQCIVDVGFLGTVKDRGRDRNATGDKTGFFNQIVAIHAAKGILIGLVAIGKAHGFTHRRQVTRTTILLQSLVDP